MGDAVDGTLGDSGMGGAEAFEGGLPADLPPLFATAAGFVAKEILPPGDPHTLERMDGPAGGIAELGVIEGDGR